MKKILASLICILYSITAYGVELDELLQQIALTKTNCLEAFGRDSDEFTANVIVGVDSHDVSRAATSLIIYWLSGADSSNHGAELIWWRSQSPMLRSLAAALLLTGRGEQTSDVPFLDSSRFNDQERRARQQEIELIEKGDKQLGAALKALIEATYPVNPNEWKVALRLRFSGY